jgi:transposase
MAKRSPSKLPASGALGPTAARKRRLQAARLFAQGLSQAEVARRLGVSRQTARRWQARWRQGGRAGLAGPGRWGRPSRLSEADWRRVEGALLAGAAAQGFDNDLWTLPRIAEVIWRLTGVSYHPGHVWWAAAPPPLEPAAVRRRAAERDEQEIARWRAEEWPRIKGALKQGAWLCLWMSPAPPFTRRCAVPGRRSTTRRSFGIGCGAASGSQWRGVLLPTRRLRCTARVSPARRAPTTPSS